MSGALIYQLFTSTGLFSYGLCHLISATRNHLKSPTTTTYTAKPYHPLPLLHHRLRHLPLYLLILSFSLSFLSLSLSSLSPDPLLKFQLHHFTSLQSSFISLLFLLLSVLLLLTESTSFFSLLPSDLLFAAFSSAFFLHSSTASSRASLVAPSSALEAHCDSLSSRLSAVCSLLCLLLAAFPRLFVADVALAAVVCLHGLWALQTGLSLHVEGFIPEGCHRLLDVVSGVEGSTKCELEESRLRAVAILDLAFVVHVLVVVVLVLVVYGVVVKVVGVSRRFGSYESLPNIDGAAVPTNHVQLKTLSGTQA